MFIYFLKLVSSVFFESHVLTRVKLFLFIAAMVQFTMISSMSDDDDSVEEEIVFGLVEDKKEKARLASEAFEETDSDEEDIEPASKYQETERLAAVCNASAALLEEAQAEILTVERIEYLIAQGASLLGYYDQKRKTYDLLYFALANWKNKEKLLEIIKRLCLDQLFSRYFFVYCINNNHDDIVNCFIDCRLITIEHYISLCKPDLHGITCEYNKLMQCKRKARSGIVVSNNCLHELMYLFSTYDSFDEVEKDLRKKYISENDVLNCFVQNRHNNNELFKKKLKEACGALQADQEQYDVLFDLINRGADVFALNCAGFKASGVPEGKKRAQKILQFCECYFEAKKSSLENFYQELDKMYVKHVKDEVPLTRVDHILPCLIKLNDYPAYNYLFSRYKAAIEKACNKHVSESSGGKVLLDLVFNVRFGSSLFQKHTYADTLFTFQ